MSELLSFELVICENSNYYFLICIFKMVKPSTKLIRVSIF